MSDITLENTFYYRDGGFFINRLSPGMAFHSFDYMNIYGHPYYIWINKIPYRYIKADDKTDNDVLYFGIYYRKCKDYPTFTADKKIAHE